MIRNLLNWWQRKPLSCDIQATSLIGPRHENQDNYLVIATNEEANAIAQWLNDGVTVKTPCPNWSKRWIRLAIMDGMGGHKNGKEIAQAATQQLQAISPCTTLKKQYRALLKLHRNLQQQFSDGQLRSPGTTIVWAEIDLYRHVCHLVHLGDSRAWLWNGNEWQRLTWDQTNLEFNFRDGRVDSVTYLRQLDRPGQPIAQALGYGSWGIRLDEAGQEIFGFDHELRIDTPITLPSFAQDHVDSYTLKLAPETLLLLASDGLWNAAKVCLPDFNVITANTTRDLANAALGVGGRDNITLVLGIFKL